jgi:hypothetical protein
MTYQAFKRVVTENRWDLATLRCDVAPPSEKLLALMDEVGLVVYEWFVRRLEREKGERP